MKILHVGANVNKPLNATINNGSFMLGCEELQWRYR